jgi:hypothetical protein
MSQLVRVVVAEEDSERIKLVKVALPPNLAVFRAQVASFVDRKWRLKYLNSENGDDIEIVDDDDLVLALADLQAQHDAWKADNKPPPSPMLIRAEVHIKKQKVCDSHMITKKKQSLICSRTYLPIDQHTDIVGLRFSGHLPQHGGHGSGDARQAS